MSWPSKLRSTAVAFPSGLALVLLGVAIATFVPPRENVAHVQMEFNRGPQDLKILETGRSRGRASESPQFIEDQLNIISSQEALGQIAEELGLNQQWKLSPRETILKLAANLRTAVEPGTDMINITYCDSDPSMAATIVNGIAKFYQNHITIEERNQAREGFNLLTIEAGKQTAKAEAARLKMFDLQRTYDIVDLAAIFPHFPFGEPDSHFSTNVFIANLGNLESQIKRINNLDGDQLIRAAADLDPNDALIKVIRSELQKMNAKRELLAAFGCGDQHRRVMMTNRKAANLRSKLEKAARSCREALPAKLELARRAYELTQASTGAATPDQRKRFIELFEARKDYDLQMTLLAHMESRIATESVDIQMPRSPLIIHETTGPPRRPIQPGVRLKILVGAILGVFLAALLVLLTGILFSRRR